jgi:hypothetical protein
LAVYVSMIVSQASEVKNVVLMKQTFLFVVKVLLCFSVS